MGGVGQDRLAEPRKAASKALEPDILHLESTTRLLIVL